MVVELIIVTRALHRLIFLHGCNIKVLKNVTGTRYIAKEAEEKASYTHSKRNVIHDLLLLTFADRHQSHQNYLMFTKTAQNHVAVAVDTR